MSGDPRAAGALPPAARRAADALLAFTAAAVPLSTTGMEAGIIGLGVLSAVAVVARWPVVRRTPLDALLAVFYAALALSTLASGHPLQATGWARLWVVLAYFVVFWWLRDAPHAARLARIVVVAGVVAAAYGLLQHATGVDWYRGLLGRPILVRPREEGETGYAVIGFFRNYLTFAHTMLFPFAWAAAWAASGSVGAAAAALVILLAIVHSTARGAWLAMAAIVLALAAIGRARRAGVLVAVLAAAGVLAIGASPDLRREAGAMFARGGINAGRVGIYGANLDVVHDHPVLGLGFGRYERAAAPYYAAHPTADRRSHAHSDYLQMAAEAGLVGLAAFVLLYLSALRAGWLAVRRTRGPAAWAAAGAWCGVVGFLVGGATQYNFGDNEVAIAMWLALAVLMRCREA